MKSDFDVILMIGFIVSNVRKEVIDHRNILVFDLEQSNDSHHRELKDVKI